MSHRKFTEIHSSIVRMRMSTFLIIAALLLLLPARSVWAQSGLENLLDLGRLPYLKKATFRQIASTDTTGGNADRLVIPAGVTALLADIPGPVTNEFATYRPEPVNVEPGLMPYVFDPDLAYIVNLDLFTSSTHSLSLTLRISLPFEKISAPLTLKSIGPILLLSTLGSVVSRNPIKVSVVFGSSL